MKRLVATWSLPDQQAFERKEVYDLFMKDLEQVFIEGKGPETLSQELAIYRHYGFSVRDLPAEKRITLWHGLADNIVPATMAWTMANTLPNAEANSCRAAISWRSISPARLSSGCGNYFISAAVPGRASPMDKGDARGQRRTEQAEWSPASEA